MIEFLANFGVKYIEDDTTEDPHFVLKEATVIIARKLTKHLQAPDALPTFKTLFEAYCDKLENVKLLMLSTILRQKPNKDMEPTTIMQSSLMHMFLTMDIIQAIAMKVVLRELSNMLASDQLMIKTALEALVDIPCIQNEAELANALLENLDVCERTVKQEMFYYLPKILSGDQVSLVATNILKYMEEDEVLTDSVIECLERFGLPPESITEVSAFIMDNCLQAARYVPVFPALFNFLMHNNPKNRCEIFPKLRSMIDKLMRSDYVDEKVLFHSNLLTVLTSTDLRNFVLKSNEIDGKPTVDFYLIVNLRSLGPVNQMIAGNVIKKKLRENKSWASVEVLTKFFDRYCSNKMLSLVFDNIRGLSTMLQISNMDEMRDLGAELFQRLFWHKDMTAPKRLEILDELPTIVESIDKKHQIYVFAMIRKMLLTKKFDDYLLHLVPLLEQRHALTLPCYRILFKLAAQCGKADLNRLHELRVETLKAMASNYEQSVAKGIAGASALAKCYDVFGTKHAPDVMPQAAMDLIDMIAAKCAMDATRLGFAYDEMANGISSVCNPRLIEWRFNTSMRLLRDDNVTSILPPEEAKSQLHLVRQFQLDGRHDDVDSLNIAEMLVNAEYQTKVFTLAAHLRYVCVLARNINGGAELINPLLFCGLFLPDHTDLEVYAVHELPIVADCLYHAINWFREVVSGFIRVSHNVERHYVIRRLEHIIELEAAFEECIRPIPEYKPPKPYFTPAPAWMKFRDVDFEICRLLKYNVETLADNVVDETEITISVNVLLFILKDHTQKVREVLHSKQHESEYPIKRQSDREHLMEDCASVTVHVHRILQHVANEIRQLQAINDNGDTINYGERAGMMKQLYDVIMSHYRLVLCWDGFKDRSQEHTLLHYLRSLRQGQCNREVSHTVCKNELVRHFLANMSALAAHCLTLSSAANMARVMEQVCKYDKVRASAHHTIVARTCEGFMQRIWSTVGGKQTAENKRLAREHVRDIASVFMAECSLSQLTAIAHTCAAEAHHLTQPNGRLTSYPLIDAQNMHVMYSSICAAFEKRFAIELRERHADRMRVWSKILLMQRGLMTIAKRVKQNRLLLAYTRTSLHLLEQFSHGCVDMITEMTRRKPGDVQVLLAHIEATNGFLQKISVVARDTKHPAFSRLVPRVLVQLDKVVFQMKCAMAAMDCEGAYFTGILRNRNLSGETIISQEATFGEMEEDAEIVDDTAEGTYLLEGVSDTDNWSAASLSEVFSQGSQ